MSKHSIVRCVFDSISVPYLAYLSHCARARFCLQVICFISYLVMRIGNCFCVHRSFPSLPFSCVSHPIGRVRPYFVVMYSTFFLWKYLISHVYARTDRLICDKCDTMTPRSLIDLISRGPSIITDKFDEVSCFIITLVTKTDSIHQLILKK